MLVFYYILALIFWIFGAIILFFLSFKEKYKISIPSRFFLIKNPKFKDAKYHFHACSFGEILALKPLLERFEDKAISVVTQTGFNEAKKISQNTRFLPFEIFLPFWLKPVKTLVVFEAELWLMLVAVAKFKGARVLILNARISDKSYKKYLKFKFFYGYFFKFVDEILAQSDVDKSRLESLGAKNIKIFGNIKSANLVKPNKIYKKPKERLIILASTHKREESLILQNLSLGENDKIVIAPRHPERFKEVENIAKIWANNKNFSFAKFSRNQNIDAKVNLLDTLGELVNFYAISDIVVLCGSFLPGIGGHNPFEVAEFDNVLISGKYIFNQKTLFGLVENVYFAEPKNLQDLLSSDLKKSKIKQKTDIDQIVKEIEK